MGVLYDVYQTIKKRHCHMCGCILEPKHEGDICECCLDDLYASDPGEDEPGYPALHYYDEYDAREVIDECYE